jgi:hypothetical protein
LYRQIGWLLTLEDSVDIAGRSTKLVDNVRPIGDQTALGDEEAFVINRG